MNVMLDEGLVTKTKRKPRTDALSDDDCVAINLFWRKGVRVPLLARGVSHIQEYSLLSGVDRHRRQLPQFDLFQQRQGNQYADRSPWRGGGVATLCHRRHGARGQR